MKRDHFVKRRVWIGQRLHAAASQLDSAGRDCCLVALGRLTEHHVGWVDARDEALGGALGEQAYGHAQAEAELEYTVGASHLHELDDPAVVVVGFGHESACQAPEPAGWPSELIEQRLQPARWPLCWSKRRAHRHSHRAHTT